MDAVGLSKFLSLILRHDPGSVGLVPDAGGWLPVAGIVAAAPFPVTAAEIAAVVAGSDKRRFALSEDGTRIRASQGHSFPVDLGLTPLAPPGTLWHGTAERFLPAIRAEGLRPMARQHVHLSPDPDTARIVGARHGRPVVLTVAAGRMAAAGHLFCRAENGVWLTAGVPPAYLDEAAAQP